MTTATLFLEGSWKEKNPPIICKSVLRAEPDMLILVDDRDVTRAFYGVPYSLTTIPNDNKYGEQ